MSNKRELKKDIQTLVELVISDAIELSFSFEAEEDRKRILEIIVKAANLHNNLISRVNHPDGKDNPKLVKKHYQQIKTDLLVGCDQAFDDLNKLVPQ